MQLTQEEIDLLIEFSDEIEALEELFFKHDASEDSNTLTNLDFVTNSPINAVTGHKAILRDKGVLFLKVYTNAGLMYVAKKVPRFEIQQYTHFIKYIFRDKIILSMFFKRGAVLDSDYLESVKAKRRLLTLLAEKKKKRDKEKERKELIESLDVKEEEEEVKSDGRPSSNWNSTNADTGDNS